LRSHGDADLTVWTVAEECLNGVVKALVSTHTERVLFELYKGTKLRSKAVKDGDATTRPQRAALAAFAEVAHFVKPAKCRKYATSLAQQLVDYATQPAPDEPLLETLAATADKLAAPLVGYLDRAEVSEILTAFLGNLSSPSGAIRRAVCRATVAFIRHHHAAAALVDSVIEILGVTCERAVSDTDTRAVVHSSNSGQRTRRQRQREQQRREQQQQQRPR
jgi:hypothetical protein